MTEVYGYLKWGREIDNVAMRRRDQACRMAGDESFKEYDLQKVVDLLDKCLRDFPNDTEDDTKTRVRFGLKKKGWR